MMNSILIKIINEFTLDDQEICDIQDRFVSEYSRNDAIHLFESKECARRYNAKDSVFKLPITKISWAEDCKKLTNNRILVWNFRYDMFGGLLKILPIRIDGFYVLTNDTLGLKKGSIGRLVRCERDLATRSIVRLWMKFFNNDDEEEEEEEEEVPIERLKHENVRYKRVQYPLIERKAMTAKEAAAKGWKFERVVYHYDETHMRSTVYSALSTVNDLKNLFIVSKNKKFQHALGEDGSLFFNIKKKKNDDDDRCLM